MEVLSATTLSLLGHTACVTYKKKVTIQFNLQPEKDKSNPVLYTL